MKNLTLNLLISHPSMDPGLITDQLALKPQLTQRNGDQIVTPKGKVAGGLYKWTKWRYFIELENSDLLNDEIHSLITILYVKRQFFNEIRLEDGKSIMYINHSCQEHLNLVLDPEVLEKLCKMSMSFGVEIFND